LYSASFCANMYNTIYFARKQKLAWRIFFCFNMGIRSI